ncbi:MAG: baseplate J/gp47 family protein, partial [Desulfobacteraceae bacterium]
MAIQVTLSDVNDAEDFLEQYLSAKIADGDYTDGSMLRDTTIKAISYVFAYLKKLDVQIRARQSLKSIDEIDTSDDTEAADDAADEIISNWFATRNRGTFARVSAYGHVSERIDISVPADVIFYKTTSLPFILDNNGESLQISAEELIAQFDAEGVVTDYTFRIPLVAQSTGASFNISRGRFVTFNEFNPYVTYVETLEKASGGSDIETTEAFIERSKNLQTIRNLINARSCDAVLRDT